MATRLVKLFVKNVAAVDKAANRRQFLVVKDMGMMSEACPTCKAKAGEPCEKGCTGRMKKSDFDIEEFQAELTKAGKKISAARMSKLKALHQTLQEIISEQEGEDDMAEKNAVKPDKTVLAKMGRSIAAMFGRAMGADEAEIKELEKGDDQPDLSPEVQNLLEKSHQTNVALVERLEKTEGVNKTLAEEVQRLRDEADLRKFADEVNGFKDIGLDPTKDAALLKSVTEKLPKEHADRIREIFKSAAAASATAAMFEEIGKSTPGVRPGSVAEEVQSKVAEIVSKNDKISPDKAQTMVFQANPGLYERWRRETTIGL